MRSALYGLFYLACGTGVVICFLAFAVMLAPPDALHHLDASLQPPAGYVSPLRPKTVWVRGSERNGRWVNGYWRRAPDRRPLSTEPAH